MESVAAGKEFCHLIQIFASDLRNLPIVMGIDDFFSNLFNFRPQSRHRGSFGVWIIMQLIGSVLCFLCLNNRGNCISDALSPSAIENLVVPKDEAYEADIRKLFPKNKENQNHGDEPDPHAMFNVLDLVLVETMERLKKLREGFRMIGRCSFHQGMASVLHSDFRLASDSDDALIRMLCSSGKKKEVIHAGKLVEILEEHFEESNVITLTILMDGCCRQGDIIQALEVWNEMFEKGIRIDRTAFNVLINGFCLVQDMKVAYKYFSEMFKRGFLPDVVTFNTLISGFARKGSIHEACDIHNRMELDGLRPNAISYKLVIQTLCKQGNITEAFSFLCKMFNDQLTPDRRTWNIILTSYARHGDISGAYSTRDMMVAMGVVPNVFTYNALIHANVKGEHKTSSVTEKGNAC
ncbi:pentatricopeptide repeat-containing protein At5g24830-like [Asparagus officinalis]|uniref:pentatricopeptide repeat-containing protein At5g24830-like n=1 Tax=Asparagus officinalis TaxID=4686 RepID=UPI00098DEDFC|nr:pentatricopeptide repeat-containing protein At5g24830-like [Asparagus officinalis]